MTDAGLHADQLATFRKFMARLPECWRAFLRQRESRLAQQARNDVAAEKVAENIVEDLFTVALDWSVADLNNQLRYADIVLTKQGIKRLLVEVKRPGALKWDQPSLEQALAQARRYADEQRVRSIAVSDGTLFYAADILNGGLRCRARVLLDATACSPDVWWLSVDGIYRPAVRLGEAQASAVALPLRATQRPQVDEGGVLLHPRYRRPAECFAYVGDASRPRTWKLPYRNADGSVDEAHLPGAVRAVVSNYRGARAKTVPDAAVPDVLVRLGRAAAEIRKLPGQTASNLESYRQLYDALYQLGRLNEIPV